MAAFTIKDNNKITLVAAFTLQQLMKARRQMHPAASIRTLVMMVMIYFVDGYYDARWWLYLLKSMIIMVDQDRDQIVIDE